MTFDTSISLGNIVTIVSFIITITTLHRQNINRIANMDFKVALMWKQFAKKFDLPDDIEHSVTEK